MVIAFAFFKRIFTRSLPMNQAPRVIPFLAFPDEIRRIVYTTNTVESLHMQVRKTIKTRGQFPNDDAALRLIWLAIMRAKTSWKTCYNWTQAMAVLRIHFGDRIPENT